MMRNNENESGKGSPSLFVRDSELKKIIEIVRNEEKEGMVLISGEAGIGKSSIINEATRKLKEMGHGILTGACYHHRVYPLSPFIDIIRDLYEIRPGDLSDRKREELIREISDVLDGEEDQAGEILGLIEPGNEPTGGYSIDSIDRIVLIRSLISSGMRVMTITDEGSQIPDDIDQDLITSFRIGREENELDPGRLDIVGNTIIDLFRNERHAALIIDPYSKLARSIQKKRSCEFIKMIIGQAVKNDGAVFLGGVDNDTREECGLEQLDQQISWDNPGQEKRYRENIGSHNEAIFRLLVKKARKQPLIIVIEDMQWGDETSFNLVQYIARDARMKNLFLMGSYRSEEMGIEIKGGQNAPLRNALQRMTRERLFVTVDLKRFDKEGTKEMIRGIIKEEPGRRLLEDVWKESKGNPLYIRNYMSTDIQGYNPDIITNRRFSDPRNLVSLRLRSLSDDERKVLDLISVLDVDNDIDRISKLTGIESGRILDIVDDLLELRFLKETGERFDFEHEKVRSAVYDLMDEDRRKDFHRSSAEIIVKVMDRDDPTMMSRLSEHYLLGGDHQQALDTILEISAMRSKELPPDVSFIHLTKAVLCLDLLEKNEENLKKRIDILQRKAYIEERLGKLEDAMGSLLESVQIGETMKLSRGLSTSYRRIGDLKLKLFKWDQTVDFYLKSLNISKKEKNNTEIAKAFRGLGNIYFHKGDFSRSMECYIKYMEYPTGGEGSIQTDAMVNIGDIYYQMGDFNQSLTYYKLAIKKGEEEKDITIISLGYIKMAVVLLRLGEVEDAMRFAEHSFKNMIHVVKRGDYQQILLDYIDLMIELGEMEKADEGLDQLKEIAGPMTNLLLEAQKHRVMGIYLSRKRDFKGSTRHLRSSLDILDNINIPFHKALTYFHFGLIRFQQMDVEGALELLKKANSLFKEIKALHFLNRTSSKVREVSFIKEGLKT